MTPELARQILMTIDPSITLDGLSDDALMQEAGQVALVLAEDSGGLELEEEIALQLYPFDRVRFVHNRRHQEAWGKLSQAELIAGYLRPEQNPYPHLSCGSCLHWQARQCEIVEGVVEEGGVCRHAIVPVGAVRRIDSKIVQWKGLKIGITHEPGEYRFSYGPPMRSFYGTIHRSWGSAEDGKAIDVYLSQDFNPEQDYRLWRVAQRDPETGALDEYKYGIGYEGAKQFADDFLYHAGRDRFGVVEEVPHSLLDNYRADATYHADSCGCEACAMKSRRRKKRKTAPEPEREDAEPEAIDTAIEMAQKSAFKAIGVWSKKLKARIGKHASLEEAKTDLESNLEEVYEALPDSGFQGNLGRFMLLAELAGREDPGDRLDSTRTDAPRPEWLRLQFDEAIEAFRQKQNISAADLKAMQEGYHDWAFSISGISRSDILEDARWLIDQAIAEGTSFEDFQQQWQRLIGRKAGWNPGERRLYTIFDANLRSAYGTGRGQQMLQVQNLKPYILWRWRDSPQPRPHHQALHNKAIPSSHKFWQKVKFNCGFGCRCSGFAVSEAYCRQNGIEILNSPPDPETIADPGFRYPLAGLSTEQKQEQIQQMLNRVPESLRGKIGGQ